MAWGCKQKPNGCGWAWTFQYPGSGQQEWSCEVCEREGVRMVRIEGDRRLWCGETDTAETSS